MDGVNSTLTPPQTGQHAAQRVYREQEPAVGSQAFGDAFVSWG